jgi:hypothetical protein
MTPTDRKEIGQLALAIAAVIVLGLALNTCGGHHAYAADVTVTIRTPADDYLSLADHSPGVEPADPFIAHCELIKEGENSYYNKCHGEPAE